MRKILITGCAGLLGSHLTKHFLDAGHSVIGVDNLSGGYRDFVDERCAFNLVDLTDLETLDDLFCEWNPDYVIHLAAYAAEGLSHWIRSFNYTNNVVASVNVMNCCIKYGVKKLIFTSSMAVYGNQIPPFTEDMIPSPVDPYGIAKYAVEQDLAAAREHFGLKYAIVRPHNVIGIQQNIWDKYRNVIGIWIRQLLKGEDITIFGDGAQTRAFSDIQYYMEPFERLLDSHVHNGEIFNIGADNYVSILSAARIVQQIGASYGHNSDIVHLEPRKEVKFAFCDQTKAKTFLDFEDKTDLEDTFRRMFLWAKEQPDRTVHLKDLEVSKDIYSFWRQQ